MLEAVERAAERRHLTVSQFVEKALAAQSSAVLSDPYLEARAKKATGEGWKVLDRVPDLRPQAGVRSARLSVSRLKKA